MGLSFIGVNSLDESELDKLSAYSEKFYNKTCRTFSDPLVILHIKKMKNTGNKCKYSIHGRVEAPSLLASVEYSDWDLVKTLNRTFEKIENELDHKFKTQGKKERVSFKKSMKEDLDL